MSLSQDTGTPMHEFYPLPPGIEIGTYAAEWGEGDLFTVRVDGATVYDAYMGEGDVEEIVHVVHSWRPLRHHEVLDLSVYLAAYRLAV